MILIKYTFGTVGTSPKPEVLFWIKQIVFMYCWDPELYSSSSLPPKKWELGLLTKLHLKGSEKFLDIGCGDGKFSAEIARKLPEGFILGVDLSEAMITFARDHFSRKLSKPCLCANRCNRPFF